MFEMIVTKMIKPMLDAEYHRGYAAGVSAEKLVKEKEWADREYDLLCRGIELGKEEVLKDIDREIEEITAQEFEELAQMEKEPFGFVGDMENISLVLDDVDTALEEVSA